MPTTTHSVGKSLTFTVRAGASHRVWQTLPRHLRRRAASHDVRRVPARLREKARAEVRALYIPFETSKNLRLEIKMDAPKKTNRKKPPQPGHEKRIKRTDAFLKRQSECNQFTTVHHFLTNINFSR